MGSAPRARRGGRLRNVYLGALASLADGWIRLAGGRRPGASLIHLVDPRPERWGRRNVSDVLRVLDTKEGGLTNEQAARRRRHSRNVLTTFLTKATPFGNDSWG